MGKAIVFAFAVNRNLTEPCPEFLHRKSAYLPLETQISSRHSPEAEVRCVPCNEISCYVFYVATAIHKGKAEPPQLSAVIPLESISAVRGIIIWLSLRLALTVFT